MQRSSTTGIAKGKGTSSMMKRRRRSGRLEQLSGNSSAKRRILRRIQVMKKISSIKSQR
jgi:hypothetical protein